MTRLERAIKLLEKVEAHLGVDLCVKTISKNYWSNAGYYQKWPWSGRTIHFPMWARGRIFSEIILHEAMHCFIAEKTDYIPISFFRTFTTRKQTGPFAYLEYFRTGAKMAEEDRRDGFVSSYARTCCDEDIAETFAAWVLNDFKVSGNIEYEGIQINLTKDSKLKKKFCAMKTLFLEYDFED